MWADMFPGETQAALADRVANPVAQPPKEPGLWESAASLVVAPLTGAARGLNESLRVSNRLMGMRAGGALQPRAGLLPGLPEPAAMRQERETSERRNAEVMSQGDEVFRAGAEYWRADSATANWASNFLHESGRVLAKVAGYSVMAGTPGAVVGTSLDEGMTQTLQLQDRGVDPATARSVGLTHGAFTGLAVAVPVVGKTAMQTAGLVAVSGPGAYMAESALSREILQRADYAAIASEFDPFDTTGLLTSLVPGAAVGAAVHASRARGAGRGKGAEPVNESRVRGEPLPDEMVDAAQVQYQADAIQAASLGRVGDPEAMASHMRALEEARAALDEGRPVDLPQLHLDETRARAALEQMGDSLRAADVGRIAQEQRAVAEPLGAETPQRGSLDQPVAIERQAAVPVEPTGQQAAAHPEVQRALEVTRERPELPVRMEDDGSPARPAAEFVRMEAQAAAREASEAVRAINAAVECFLRLGGE